jgi:hypothetical protein
MSTYTTVNGQTIKDVRVGGESYGTLLLLAWVISYAIDGPLTREHGAGSQPTAEGVHGITATESSQGANTRLHPGVTQEVAPKESQRGPSHFREKR